MADIAEIGFVAKTDQLEKAKTSLTALRPAAEGAEKAADKLNKKLNEGRASAGAFATAVEKSVGGLKSVFSGFVGQISGFGAAIGGAFALANSISGARELSKNVANLTTVLPDGTKNLNAFTAAGANMADTFATSVATQIDALYEAVSAGATSFAQSTAIVDTANRLAIGGSASLAQGIDVLTTATNAYAKQALTAKDASDAIFVGVAAGKARVEEFASSLGNVIPIASSMNVKFDELIALMSALTLSGIKVSEAGTAVRSILSNILKPSSQATKEAKALGLQFDATALQAKGLSGFLQDVITKTHGNQTALAQLFGDVEGLNAVLSLVGAGGDNFTDILGQMANKAGATDKAFATMAENLDFRTQKLVSKLENAATSFGTLVLQLVVPVGEAIVALIDGTSPIIPLLERIGLAFAIAFGPLIVAGIIALTGYTVSLSYALGVQLVAAAAKALAGLWALALANPFIALATAIAAVIAVLVTFNDEIAKATGYNFIQDLINSFNQLIGSAVGTYQSIIVVWQQFPGAMSDFAISAANSVIDIIQGMVDRAIDLINQLLEAVNNATANIAASLNKLPGLGGSFSGTDFNPIDPPTIPKFSNPNKGEFQQMLDDIDKVQKAANIDYFGPLADAMKKKFGGVAQAFNVTDDSIKKVTRSATGAAGPLNAVGDAGKKAGGGASEAKTALETLNDTFKKLGDNFTQAQTAFKTLGDLLGNGVITNEQYAASVDKIKTAFDAAGGSAQQWALLSIGGMNEQFKAMNEPFSQTQTAFNSLVELQKNGIITNDQYTASLQKLKDTFIATGGTSDQWARIISKNSTDVGKQLEDLGKKSLTDLGDAFIDLAMTGKANFKQLAQSIIKDLLRIMWQALVVKPLLASFGLGSGGTATPVTYGTGNLYAKGAAFLPTRKHQFAGGGAFTNKVFDQPTLFRYAQGSQVGELGEKGPEGVLPLKRGRDGKLGVQSHGGGGGNKSTVLQMNIGGNTYNIEGAISQEVISAQIKGTAEATLEVTKKSMTGWLQQIQRDGSIV